MQKAFIIILISCYQGVSIPILDPGIEYPGMENLPIMMNNVIKTHVNHHVSPVVDTYFSHHLIFVHLCCDIEYGLFLL